MKLGRIFDSEKIIGKKNSEKRLIFLCIALTIAVLIFDFMVPLGVAGGVPYVMVIMLALLSKRPSHVISFVFICSLLTMLGLFFSESGGVKWVVLTNRILALIVILATGFLGLHLKRVQLKLLESEGRFKLMADQAPIMIWQTNSKGAWDFFSKGWLDYTGKTAVEASDYDWAEIINQKDRQRVVSLYRDALRTQSTFQAECRIQNKGGNYRWVTIHGAPHFFDNSKFAGFVGTIIDINDRKETELSLEEARQILFHREKMVAIGTLGSGILHEIGNPVASIAGLVQEMLDEITPAEQEPEGLNIEQRLKWVLEYLNKLILINRDISDFTTMYGDEVTPHNINDFIGRTCRLIRHDERMLSIDLSLQLDNTIPPVNISTDHFIQILLNLLENSISACSDRNSESRIVVQTKADSNFIHIEVSDNGHGMSSNELASAADALFTTKKESKGLGLTLCQTLVNGNGGTMEITSTLNEGTTVSITFPVHIS